VKDKPLKGVKAEVLRTRAYTLRAHEAEIKLNQNENPYDFPDDLKDEIFRLFRQRQWSRYPDFVPDGIRARLAEFAGWHKDGVLIGNGSNEVLLAALMVLVGSRSRVAIPAPTFTLYGLMSRILGAKVVEIPLNADLSYGVDRLIAGACEARAKVLVVCTPNNPTGSVLAESDVKRILDSYPGYLLLDEAYYDFCGQTAIKLLGSYPRLIVTRTFSKAMGMAGLRIGYLLAHPDLAAEIAKAKLPYNVNQFSLTAIQVVLDHPDRFRPAIDRILAEKARLAAELRQVPGIKVYPSGANFFLIELPIPPGTVFEDLYRTGVLVRDVSSYPMLSRCLRVSIGTREEDDRFISSLRDSLAQASVTGSMKR
jgi:histidinol-phosphate aminotransferase